MLLRRDQTQIYEELYHLQNCEMALGAYYQQLAELYPKERMIWETAFSDEVGHAHWVGQVIALVATDIGNFSQGRFRIELLRTFLEGIYQNLDKASKGELTRKELLQLALDYEHSLVLQKPYEAVQSALPDFVNLVKGHAPEVQEHSQRLQNYLRQKLAELG